jgi:hypothetical protein
MNKQRGGQPSLLEYTGLVLLASALYFVAHALHVLWR